MNDFFNFFLEVSSRADYPRWLLLALVIGVALVSQLLKLPIKKLTGKIPNDTLRKKVNIVIMLVPCGLGILASWLLTFFGYNFTLSGGLIVGFVSQVVYEFVSRLLKRVKSGEDLTEENIAEIFKEAVTHSKEIVGTAQEAESKFSNIVNNIKKSK